MSITKQMLIEIPAEYFRAAYSILKELGYIEECDICEGYYVLTEDLTDEIYAKATKLFKKKYPELNDFSMFHESLKGVENNSGIDSIKEHIEDIHYGKNK